LLAVGCEDGTVRLWETDTGTEIGVLEGHRGAVVALAFLPDGKGLVSGGTDTTALLWDVARFVQERRAAPADLPPAQVAKLWEQRGGDDADQAYDALVKLAAVPAQTLPLVKQIKPVPALDKDRLARLLADLEGNGFEQRKQAMAALIRLGDLAEGKLRQRLAENPPLEVRQRVKQLLDKAAAPATEPESLQALRTVELLEHIGTAEARAQLQTIAAGAPEARLTRQANAALKRLARRKGD